MLLSQINNNYRLNPTRYQFWNWLFKIMELEFKKFGIGISYKTNEIHKLIYHFYNVNTYMWCYQHTGTKMIQNFGSIYIYIYIYQIRTPTVAPQVGV